MTLTVYQKKIFYLYNTQQAIIWDQWCHLELMEPRWANRKVLKGSRVLSEPGNDTTLRETRHFIRTCQNLALKGYCIR